MKELTLELITQAGDFLEGHIRRTPVEYSPKLSEAVSAPVWLKLEHQQVTGSFKLRGAMFRLSRLTQDERKAGVATCSAGNHGKAVAYAAREMAIKPTIYVPSSVDETKFQGMVDLGAEVIRSQMPGYDDTEAWALKEIEASGKVFISAFDDHAIMAANGGTLAKEVLAQVPDASTFILPVGGGGMSAGFAFYAKQKLPNCSFIGCQHELSPALKLSLERGKAVTRLPAIETFAQGVEGGIGGRPFAVLGPRVDNVALVSEDEICTAFRWVLAQHQYLIEPTAAVPIAACLAGKIGKLAAPAVIVLSGRNVCIETVEKLLGE